MFSGVIDLPATDLPPSHMLPISPQGEPMSISHTGDHCWAGQRSRWVAGLSANCLFHGIKGPLFSTAKEWASRCCEMSVSLGTGLGTSRPPWESSVCRPYLVLPRDLQTHLQTWGWGSRVLDGGALCPLRDEKGPY